MPSHHRGWVGGGRLENRHTPLTGSMLEPALLLLLKEQPRHGYTLLADLNSQFQVTILLATHSAEAARFARRFRLADRRLGRRRPIGFLHRTL